MKQLKRLFCLLLVCVCLSVLFLNSLTVSAASMTSSFSPENYLMIACQISTDGGESWEAPGAGDFTLNDNGSGHLNISIANTGIQSFTHWRAEFEPTPSAGNLIVEPYMQLYATFYYQHFATGSYSNQSLTGAMYITTSDGTIYEFPLTDQYRSEDDTCWFVTVGGTVEVLEAFQFADCTIELRFSGISAVGGVSLDFHQFSLTAKETIGEETATIVESIEQGFANLESNQDENTQDIIDNQDENTQEIIENDNKNAEKTFGFLQNIWDAIVSIPQKIWEFIETGLKNLFVPDEEYIVAYKGKWDTLLSSRFGAVYEAFDIMISFVSSIKDASADGTVELPEIEIPLPDNNKFVFGPYEVDVIPDGFEFLVATCKTITLAVAAFMLVNALRKRWDEVIG